MKEQMKLRIVRAYQVHKSIRKVAKILGVSYGTIHAILKERKALQPWSGFNKIDRWKGGNRGPVTRWIQKHPDVVLSSSIEEIASLVGCEPRFARSWKVARWEKMKRIAKKLVPKKIIKKMSYDQLKIFLVDGSALTAEELFSLQEKAKLKKLRDEKIS